MLANPSLGLVGELGLSLHARVEVAGPVLDHCRGGGGGGGGQGALGLPSLNLPPLSLRVDQFIVGAVVPASKRNKDGVKCQNK